MDSRITTGAPLATVSRTATGVPTTMPLEGGTDDDLRAGDRVVVSVGHVGQAAGIGKMLGSCDTDATAASRSTGSIGA